MKKTTNNSGVYKILNQVNNKVYIGSSKSIENRISTHISRLKRGVHRNKHLQSSWIKYGAKNFLFSVVEFCEVNELLEREQCYIDSYNKKDMYNKTFIAGSGGADSLSNPLLLLDLKGNIVNRFNSGTDAARYLNKRILNYSSINTKAISSKKYRIVTPLFYSENREIINSWRSYSCEYEHNYGKRNKYKYKVKEGNNTTEYKHLRTIAQKYDVTTQRISLAYREVRNKNKHKFTIKGIELYLTLS